MADKAFMSFTQNGEQVGLGHSLLVGGDTMEYRALVSDVAKKIIEDYAGSTLAGSAQSVQAALAALNSNLTDLYIVETVKSNELRIEANDRGVFTINIAKTGYTPIGIVGISLSVNWMYIGGYSISNNNAKVIIHNGVNRSAATQTIYPYVLYRKDI